MNLFQVSEYKFPYRNLTFPGQHSDETILFVTREGKAILYLKFLAIIIIALIALLFSLSLTNFLSNIIPRFYLLASSFLAIMLLSIIAIWWVYTLWRKSVFIITTRRLTKFIHTTPWNRYQLSLGLDKIVDTGSYQKGLIQSLTGLGYFVARSSAGNIKNFKIINISFAEDLQNYINKLLFTFTDKKKELDSFRPFIPHLKGEARKQYVRSITPEYYQDR